MANKIRVLFLCTGNSCRSQMAEALLRHMGGERFEPYSAGSTPAGFIHPLAIAALKRLDVAMSEQESKSWDVFAEVPLDAVITLCDQAARESCPTWPGGPAKAHWPLPDPAYHPGTEAERAEFALRIAERLRAKIAGLLALEWQKGRAAIEERLRFLGEI